MRGQGDGLGQIDLSAGVMQALENSEVEARPSRRRIGVVVGTRRLLLQRVWPLPDDWAEHSAHRNAGPAEQAPIEFSPATIANPLALQAGVAVQQQMQTPQLRPFRHNCKKEIEAYIIRHAEHSAASGQQGLLPLARVMETDQESQ